jgi:hypothetical protein
MNLGLAFWDSEAAQVRKRAPGGKCKTQSVPLDSTSNLRMPADSPEF